MISKPTFLISMRAGAMAMLACLPPMAVSPALAKSSTPHETRTQQGTQQGKASVYARKFHGRKMANGERFSTGSNAAASKTLPLGSRAKVTNLQTGKTEEVVIKDRGNLPPGRVVDLSPKTASDLGVTTKQGVAPVKVEPTR